MQLSVYYLFDVVAQQASNPFVAPNDSSALRELDRVARRELSDVSEYQVWHLGHWDAEKRVLVALEQAAKVSRPIPDASQTQKKA